MPAAGRGAAGTPSGDTRRASPAGDGSGCRGPERICPGLGTGGAGLAGIGIPRGAAVGATGGPEANGGRKGCAAGRGAGTGSVESSRACGAASAAATGTVSVLGAACGGSAAAAGTCSAACSTAGSGDPSAVRIPLDPSARRRLISTATGSSIELEWVFFSATPSSGSRSRITLGLTSSSRASSLMRNFFIPCAPSSTCDTGVVRLSLAPYPPSPRLPGTLQYLS